MKTLILKACRRIGRAADALRSLIISQQLLGTREILVIHHTDCGKIYLQLCQCL
jgi:carbonic anhydrase